MPTEIEPGEGFVDAVMARFRAARGPWPGMGRGPGRPWGGIVEDTPALWIGWVVDAARAVGLDPLALRWSVGGVPLTMTTVALTFGTRYYWRCPSCGRRCEAIYTTNRVGCRECLHLGYRSQAQRKYGAYWYMDRIFGRYSWFTTRRRAEVPQAVRDAVHAHLREAIERKIRALVDQVDIELAKDVSE